MKKYAIQFVILICANTGFAQVISNSMINNTPGYTLSVSIQNENFTYTYNKPTNQDPTSFTISPNEQIAFTRGFKDLVKNDLKILKLVRLPSKFELGDTVDIEQEAILLFRYFKGVEDVSDDLLYQPIAGSIDITSKKYVKVHSVPIISYPLRSAAKDSMKLYRNFAKDAVGKQKTESLIAQLKSDKKKQEVEKNNKKMKKQNSTKESINVESLQKRIDSLQNQLKKYERTQSSKKRFLERRWYMYNDVRYNRHAFKQIMRDEIPRVQDEIRNQYGKTYQERKDSIDQFLVTRKTTSDSLKLLQSFMKKFKDELNAFQADFSKFQTKFLKLISQPVGIKTLPEFFPKINSTDSRKVVTIEDVTVFEKFRNRLSTLISDSSVLEYTIKQDGDSLAKHKDSKEYKKDLEFEIELLSKEKTNIEDLRNFIKSNDFKKLEKTFDSLVSFSGRQNQLKSETYGKDDLIKKLQFILTNTTNKLQKCRKELLDGINKEYNKNRFEQFLNIKSAQIEITDGFVENMQVIGQVGNRFKYLNDKLELRDTIVDKDGLGEIKLGNKHPFGFSRKIDYANLEFKYLYTIDDDHKYPRFKLYLRDLVTAKTYVEEFANYRRDYSPQDTVIKYANWQTDNHYVLKKGPSYRLFEGRIYSDFVGLNRTNPNGLIQVQIDKKVNLITWRKAVGKFEWGNFGFLGYISPSVSFLKIEQTNKELLLNRIDTVGGKYAPVRYATTLDLRRHENFNTGFDLNIGVFDIPTAKSTFLLDFGFRYGRVSIVDSSKAIVNGSIKKIGSNFDVNTFRIYPRLGWLIRTDERYSFYFEGGFNWYWLRDESFRQVANNDVFRSSMNTGGHDTNKYINFLFEATLNVGASNKSSKGKLFFRYQYNQQYSYFNTGFSQAQVGYSVYLLKHK